jgi:hypothetical protein
MSETRKLAAILVSDVVGYSRLAGSDEERTLVRLRGLRSDLIDPAIAAHHGRIIKRTGDGSIIEFRSVVEGPQSLKNIAEPMRAYLLRRGAPAAQKPPQAATATRGVWARWPALAAALALLLLAAGTFAWRAGYAPRFMAASVDDKLANAPRLSIVVGRSRTFQATRSRIISPTASPTT